MHRQAPYKYPKSSGPGPHNIPSLRQSTSTAYPLPPKRDLTRSFPQERRCVYVDLITNAFSLVFQRVNYKIFEYKLQINLSKGCLNQPAQVLKRNFVSCSIRSLIMNSFMMNLGASEEVKSGQVIIDTNLTAIYCLKPLGTITMDHLSSQIFEFDNIKVVTDLVNELRVDVLIAYSRCTPIEHSATLHRTIMNAVIHHQLLNDMLRFGSTYYAQPSLAPQPLHSRSPELDIMSEYTMGFSLSGLRSDTDDLILLSINCPHAYITGPYRLVDLLICYALQEKKLSPGLTNEHEGFIQHINLQDPWFQMFCTILNGFKCQSSSLEGSVNLRFEVTSDPAMSLTMTVPSNNVEVSVYNFFKDSQMPLKYPNLPCLRSKSKNFPYYPMELCSLMTGQKVPIFRLGPAAHLKLTHLNKPTPDEFQKSSCRAKDQIISYSNLQLNSFGITLSRQPLTAKGCVLSKPVLQFSNESFQPFRDNWESKRFIEPIHLIDNWCVVNTTLVDEGQERYFLSHFANYLKNLGVNVTQPAILHHNKQTILENENYLDYMISDCQKATRRQLNFIIFVIDSNSTILNRYIHLNFDSSASITATCLRLDSIMNLRRHRAIFRTLAHKVNTRLGGTNVTYANHSLAELSLCKDELLVIGLDVTHPDNELSGVSIVGCAYTYTQDLFRHKSLVWPQTARMEIITCMDGLLERIIQDYCNENHRKLPRQIIIYRDGVSHEEFVKVREVEVTKAQTVLRLLARDKNESPPNLSYIIAQKRHTMRFFQASHRDTAVNPPGGTLIDRDVVQTGREFYLYSNATSRSTSRPLHYHVILNGLGLENLQKLTYYLCFNSGNCSSALSMPTSLKYAHNAAYDARNRVIAGKEFNDNEFYSSKYFC